MRDIHILEIYTYLNLENCNSISSEWENPITIIWYNSLGEIS